MPTNVHKFKSLSELLIANTVSDVFIRKEVTGKTDPTGKNNFVQRYNFYLFGGEGKSFLLVHLNEKILSTLLVAVTIIQIIIKL